VHGLVLSSWSQVWRLGFVFCLNIGYGIIEFFGAHHTQSWALMSDAAHMAADASSVLLALLAAVISISVQKSKAYKRAWWIERIAASLNALGLTAMSIFLWKEGLSRLQNPPDVLGEQMLWIAIGGLLVNGLAVVLFHQPSTKGQAKNLNLRGAYLHVLSDLFGSVAAILSALFIISFGWSWMDPIMSLLVATLVSIAAFQFIRTLWTSWSDPATPDSFNHPLMRLDEE